MSKVTIEEAKKWLMGAYAMTISEGHYTASRLNGIPGASLFHLAAKRTGIAEPVGARNKIVNIEEAPTLYDIQTIMKYYYEYQVNQESEAGRLDRIESKLDILIDMWE